MEVPYVRLEWRVPLPLTIPLDLLTSPPISLPQPSVAQHLTMSHPHASHIDPRSLPFQALPKDVPTCSVELLHMGWIHSRRGMWADDAWDQDERRKQAKQDADYSLPIFGALLQHGKDRYLWDLGE